MSTRVGFSFCFLLFFCSSLFFSAHQPRAHNSSSLYHFCLAHTHTQKHTHTNTHTQSLLLDCTSGLLGCTAIDCSTMQMHTSAHTHTQGYSHTLTLAQLSYTYMYTHAHSIRLAGISGLYARQWTLPPSENPNDSGKILEKLYTLFGLIN